MGVVVRNWRASADTAQNKQGKDDSEEESRGRRCVSHLKACSSLHSEPHRLAKIVHSALALSEMQECLWLAVGDRLIAWTWRWWWKSMVWHNQITKLSRCWSAEHATVGSGCIGAARYLPNLPITWQQLVRVVLVKLGQTPCNHIKRVQWANNKIVWDHRDQRYELKRQRLARNHIRQDSDCWQILEGHQSDERS